MLAGERAGKKKEKFEFYFLMIWIIREQVWCLSMEISSVSKGGSLYDICGTSDSVGHQPRTWYKTKFVRWSASLAINPVPIRVEWSILKTEFSIDPFSTFCGRWLEVSVSIGTTPVSPTFWTWSISSIEISNLKRPTLLCPVSSSECSRLWGKYWASATTSLSHFKTLFEYRKILFEFNLIYRSKSSSELFE